MKKSSRKGEVAILKGNWLADTAERSDGRRLRSHASAPCEAAVKTAVDFIGLSESEVAVSLSRSRQREPFKQSDFSYHVRASKNAADNGTGRVRARFVWPPIRARHQALYDLAEPRLRVLRKLSRSAQPVRDFLQATCDQSRLAQGQNALSVTGVIYAIFCLRTTRLYIGQTIKSTSHRFEQHVNSSLRGDNEPFHHAVRRYGWRNFSCFPLEIIPTDLYAHCRGKARVAAFRKVASPRELFWIDRLHTYSPLGFNVQHRKRQRRARKRVLNPMKRLRCMRVRADPDSGCDLVVENGRWFGSRDWLRRALYLSHRITNQSFENTNWSSYNSRSLWGIYHYLVKSENETLPAEHRSLIVATLRRLLILRPTPGSKRVNKKMGGFIRIEWTSDLIRRVGLKSVLLERDVLSSLPSGITEDDMQNMLIVKKLTTPIGLSLLNFASVSRRMPRLASDANCPCRRLFGSAFRPDGGCVQTGDVNIVQNAELRQLCKYGPRFRDRVQSDPLAAIQTGLDEYIRFMVRSKVCDKSEMRAWRQTVLDRCVEKLGTRPEKSEVPILQKPCVKKYLQFLQRNLVLVPMDKAANNIAFICKSLYVDTLRAELERKDGAYAAVTDRTQEEILASQKKHLGALMGELKLPYLYGMPKFHKAGWRFIAGSGKCSTALLSKILSDLLLRVMRSLREKDNDHILRTGIRRYFVVETYEEVASFLGRWRRVGEVNDRSMKTGDFSTMYTTIPHVALLSAVQSVTEEAFQWEASERGLEADNLRLCWVKENGEVTVSWIRASRSSSSSECVQLSIAELNAQVTFLVENIYIVNGSSPSSIRRQVVGIPMGTNCAPSLANLFLYFHESRFIDRLSLDNSDKAASFHMTFRYIDDTLSIDNPHWASACEEGTLYPPELELNDTTPTQLSEPVHFLGMDITGGATRFSLDVYDKREAFSFPVRRYPHMASLIPQSIPYGVFLSQLHRGYRTCSAAPQFVTFACDVANRLVANGCRPRRLWQLFVSFAMRFVSKFVGVKLSHMSREFRSSVGNWG